MGVHVGVVCCSQMIKGIIDHGFADELVVPIIENTAHERDLAQSLHDAIVAYPKSNAVLVRCRQSVTAVCAVRMASLAKPCCDVAGAPSWRVRVGPDLGEGQDSSRVLPLPL